MQAVAAAFPDADVRHTGNDGGPCELNGEDWPQQWIYSVRMFMKEKDTRPMGEATVTRLQAQGWTVRRGSDSPENTRVTVQKNGLSMSLSFGSSAGAFNVLGAGPCVSQDGSVDRRPLA